MWPTYQRQTKLMERLERREWLLCLRKRRCMGRQKRMKEVEKEALWEKKRLKGRVEEIPTREELIEMLSVWVW